MSRLRLSEWSQIADIVAAIAVVISLLFVGLQVRDNTEALRSQNERALVNALETLKLSRVTDAGFADMMYRAETGGELSDLDRSRIRAMAFLYLDNWEQAFHDHQKGLIDPDIWQAFDNWLSMRAQYDYFRVPVTEAAHSGTYSEDFSAHLQAVLARERDKGD